MDSATVQTTSPGIEDIQAMVAARIEEESAGQKIGEQRPLQVDIQSFAGLNYLNQYPPRYDWLLDKSLRRGCLGAIVGPPGSGKGTFAIQLAVSVAAGVPFLGIWPVSTPSQVVYLSAEDDDAVIHRRAHHALKQLPQELQTQAASNFYGIAVHGQVNLCQADKGSSIKPTLHLADLKAIIADVRPALVILDTLARFSGVEENDNLAMTAFCGVLEDLIADFGCNILLLHHANKASGDCVEDEKELSRALTQTAARGASALAGCIRWGLFMAPLGAGLAVKLIGDDARGKADGSFVVVRVGKKNAGAPEMRHYLGRDSQGLLYRTEANGQIQADGDTEADAYKLAEEVARREMAGEKPMSVSRCGQDAFSWGVSRTKKAVERGLDLGLFFKVQSGKREHLCSECSDCSTYPGTQGLFNESM